MNVLCFYRKNDAVIKIKRRRRKLATPPPADTTDVDETVDLYDRAVTDAFNHIQSGEAFIAWFHRGWRAGSMILPVTLLLLSNC